MIFSSYSNFAFSGSSSSSSRIGDFGTDSLNWSISGCIILRYTCSNNEFEWKMEIRMKNGKLHETWKFARKMEICMKIKKWKIEFTLLAFRKSWINHHLPNFIQWHIRIQINCTSNWFENIPKSLWYFNIFSFCAVILWYQVELQWQNKIY